MATPLISIGGLASGLDTQGIIGQLMQLERQPVVRFQQRQAELRKVDEAWGQVTTKLSALRAAHDKLEAPGALEPVTVQTSDDDVVRATATSTARPGSVSFTVSQLANRHQITAGGSFATADATVGVGTFTLGRADGTGEPLLSVTTDATTTVEQLATKINDAKAGFTAQAVKVADGDVRLVVTAADSGAAEQFAVSGGPASVAGTTVLTAGQDAILHMGGLELRRASNTVDDLLPGVTLDLRATTATAVTVTAVHDATAAVATVKGLVDGLNGVLSTIKDLTSYDPTSKKSKPLQGDDTARKLASDLRTALTSPVAGLTGDYTSAGSIGVGLDRYGAVTFDEAKLRAALADDPEAVTALLNRTGSSADARVAYVSSSDATAFGEHALEISQASTTAAITGTAYSPPTGSPKTFTINTGGVDVSVSVDADASIASAVIQINQALALAGVTSLTASETTSGGQPALQLGDSRAGSAGTFAVTGTDTWGLDGTHAGLDVAGTIDGVAATGSGTRLTGTSGTGEGLVVDIAGSGTGTHGPVTVSGGVLGALEGVLRWAEGDRTATDPALASGSVARARTSLTDEIRRFDRRISDYDVRLASREKTLRQKFAALESSLSQLQGRSSFLAGQMGAG